MGDKVDHLNKIKQKLESTLDELESSVEKEKRARAVAEKDRRNIEGELKMAQESVGDIERTRKELEAAIMRKDSEIGNLASKLEDELADTNENLIAQTCQNQAITGAKMKCEQEMATMGHDLDEMVSEAAMSEEKAQRAMIDAARLADELRAEQEMAMALERDKKLLEAQVKDASNRVDEAEQNALKGGKKAITKMETRVRELESELDVENR